jgi:hypothetical protein
MRSVDFKDARNVTMQRVWLNKATITSHPATSAHNSFPRWADGPGDAAA